MCRLLTIKDLCQIYQASETTIWRGVKTGVIPPPVKLIPSGSNRWHQQEIEESINALPVAPAYQDCAKYPDPGPEAA